MKNNKAEDIAYEMAGYIMLDKPIPKKLMDKLMKEVCADYKKEREGDKSSNSTASVA